MYMSISFIGKISTNLLSFLVYDNGQLNLAMYKIDTNEISRGEYGIYSDKINQVVAKLTTEINPVIYTELCDMSHNAKDFLKKWTSSKVFKREFEIK